MIKFFRKIRQNLLMENKTGKYFKYAIGEIILVVIGILIALQINNWNEQRKIKSKSQSYIDKIMNDLTVDTLNINKLIIKTTDYKQNIDNYFDFFDSNDISQSSIDELIDSSDVLAMYLKYHPVNQAFKNMEFSENGSLLNEVQRDFLIELLSKQDEFEIINREFLDRAIDERKASEQLLGIPSNFYSKLKIETNIERKTQGLLHRHLRLKALRNLYDYIESRGQGINALSREVIVLLNK